MSDINSMNRGNALEGATQYHTQLGLPDKVRVNKVLAVCNNRDLEPLDLQNSLGLSCYQLSPELLILLYTMDMTVKFFL